MVDIEVKRRKRECVIMNSYSYIILGNSSTKIRMQTGVNFTNILRAQFLPIFWRQNISEKCAHKMLVKLTKGVFLVNADIVA